MIESSIKNILKREYPEIRFNMSEYDDYVELNILVVQYNQRKTGKATQFLERLIQLAHQEQKDIFLTPDDGYAEEDGMKKPQLIKWYKKLGFKNKQKSDFRSRNTMCYYVDYV
ncbi:MAG: hypothetical protein U9N08_08170 [Candidatus Caldatribacteriota bacterium]|nr:hypothetical protein [Candidatus Caldatribacteriota bacterium]